MRFLNEKRRFAFAFVAAGLLGGVLIAAAELSSGGGHERTPRPAVTADAGIFAGIRQRGAVLGSPAAPLTLVEYADLQCPYCAEWSRRTLPVLVSSYVRTGRLRIVFRGLAFIGPDSERALRTAIAAGKDGRLWDVVHGLYLRQGAENSGWVSDTLLEEVGGPAALGERDDPAVTRALAESQAAAAAAGITGTPSFELGRTGGLLAPVRLTSLGPEGIGPAIAAAEAA